MSSSHSSSGLPPEDQPPNPDSQPVPAHPSQAGATPYVPTPVVLAVPLPGNLPSGSLLLAPIDCPDCGKRFTHVHCRGTGCRALVCVPCQLVYRPDIGTRIARAPEPTPPKPRDREDEQSDWPNGPHGSLPGNGEWRDDR